MNLRPRRLYRLAPGSWMPAHLTSADLMLVLYAMIVMPVIRAADYSTGTDKSGALTAVEAFAPIGAWAIPFTVGAFVLAYGVRSRRHLVVYVGHSILAATYTVLSVGILLGALREPWANGIRGASVLLLPVLLHWLCWWRTGPAPINPRSASPTEQVGGPTE